ESILAKAEQVGGLIVDGVLHIDHYGYRESVRVAKNKDERDRRHFEEALREEPNNAYLWFKYGDYLRRFDDSAVVIDALDRSCALIRDYPDKRRRREPYCAESFSLLALELVRANRHAEAGELLDYARQHCHPTPMMWWVSGHHALCIKDHDAALEYFDACAALDGQCLHVPAQPGITNERSHFGRARALLGLGQRETAIRMFKEGADRWPNCEDLVLAATRVAMLERRFPEAIRRLTAALDKDPENANYWQVGTELFLELGRSKDAEVWIVRAQAQQTSLSAAAVAATYGEVELAAGDLEGALDRWSRDPRHPNAKAGLILLHAVFGEPLPPALETIDAEIEVALAGVLRRHAQSPRPERFRLPLSENLAAGRALDPRIHRVISANLDPPRLTTPV
ncbi:MAG: tetratricopeptide repeat protein, partial [Salinibacterium sp.]|nr:tetratricopeptide repeat protein [Salinibacterium sp.]